jgi:probable HAF family extracellular repeat protein
MKNVSIVVRKAAIKHPLRFLVQTGHGWTFAAIFFLGGFLQAQDTTVTSPTKHQQYKLVDLGTFGGPSSIIFGLTGPLNNRGEVASCADTTTADPYAPNGNPYFGGDPFVQNAFLWKHGVLEDLKPLSEGRGSCGQWINDLGAVAGAAEDGTINPLTGYPSVVAVRWQHGKALALGSLGGPESVAFAINNRGQIAGGATTDSTDDFAGAIFSGENQVHAFRWQDGSLQDLGTLGGPDSIGFYISDRGEVAGLSYIESVVNPNTGVPDIHPFLWKDGRMIDLGSLGGSSGEPNAVNNRSEVVGNSNTAGDQAHHPFLWRQGILTDLGTLGGAVGEANWINDASEVVGTAYLPDQTHHAFVWRNGKMIDLEAVGTDPCSNGVSINSLGQVTGTSTDCHGNVLHLFLWEHGSITDLSALIRPGSDVTFVDPVMINDRGEIAGEGVLSDGTPRAVLLVPDGDCDDDCNTRIVRSSLIANSRFTTREMTSPLSPVER